MGVAITSPLPPELQVRYWERKLRQESVLTDCFTGLSGVHSTAEKVNVGNEVYFELQGSFGKQITRITVRTLGLRVLHHEGVVNVAEGDEFGVKAEGRSCRALFD